MEGGFNVGFNSGFEITVPTGVVGVSFLVQVEASAGGGLTGNATYDQSKGQQWSNGLQLKLEAKGEIKGGVALGLPKLATVNLTVNGAETLSLSGSPAIDGAAIVFNGTVQGNPLEVTAEASVEIAGGSIFSIESDPFIVCEGVNFPVNFTLVDVGSYIN